MEWWTIKSNVLSLAIWLKDEGEWDNVGSTELPSGEIVDDDPIDRLIYYFEKPWKYQNEWNKYQNFLNKKHLQTNNII